MIVEIKNVDTPGEECIMMIMRESMTHEGPPISISKYPPGTKFSITYNSEVKKILSDKLAVAETKSY